MAKNYFSEQEKAVLDLLTKEDRTTEEIGQKVFKHTTYPRAAAGGAINRINLKSRAYRLGVKITSMRIGKEKIYNLTSKKKSA